MNFKPYNQPREIILYSITFHTKCQHINQWFDRTICACDSMHDRCSDCGESLDGCPLEALDGEQ